MTEAEVKKFMDFTDEESWESFKAGEFALCPTTDELRPLDSEGALSYVGLLECADDGSAA